MRVFSFQPEATLRARRGGSRDLPGTIYLVNLCQATWVDFPSTGFRVGEEIRLRSKISAARHFALLDAPRCESLAQFAFEPALFRANRSRSKVVSGTDIRVVESKREREKERERREPAERFPLLNYGFIARSPRLSLSLSLPFIVIFSWTSAP